MPATEQFWRPLPTMHRIFAVSAIALLAATLLMMAKDERRDWRGYQRKADTLKLEQLRAQLDRFESPEFQADELRKQEALASAKAELETAETKNRISELESRRAQLQGQADILARESKFQNAERDVARANLDLNVRDAVPPQALAASESTFNSENIVATERALKLQQLQAELKLVKDELAEIYAPREAAQTDLNKFNADRRRLQEQLALVQPDDSRLPDDLRSGFAALKRSFKEWPIINGFNPHHKIEYEWPKELQIQLGMARVSRVDRCRTCHVNINDFATGNVASFPADEYHQPFSAHPHPELFLTAGSPHPIDKFGCTICHEGDGSGTSFQNAEHSPRDPSQAANWEHSHHWHSNHFWEYPMFPKHLTEASCLRCHHHVVELGVNAKFGATAPKVFEGYELIKTLGCFGCHEINGFDGTTPIGPDMRLEPQTPEEAMAIANDPNAVAGTMRKVGPSLRHIGSKVTSEFISYWTEDPARFRPTTKMPKFFHLDNQHDNLAGVLQPVELDSISAYLVEKSEPMQLLSPAEGYEPDLERGLEAFQRRGCLACHSKSGEEFAGADADFGPDLSNIHEKIKPGEDGFKWLYTWLRNPELHHPRTRMPNTFLQPEKVGEETVDPAADIAAYLLQGGAKQFPEQPESSRPSLGIVLDPDFTEGESKALRLPAFAGVKVEEVLPTGAASRALAVGADGKPLTGKDGKPLSVAERLRPILPNDVILAFDGVKVGTREQLAELTIAAGLGKRAVLKLFSNGLERMVEIRVSTPLEDLTRLHLSKSTLTSAEVDKALDEHKFPVPAHAYAPKPDGSSWNMTDFVKGDEIELVASTSDEVVDDATWIARQKQYVGRRTVARYGCYGCHDIPNFETAKPIGTPLQDWGRKDTSKLAPEHIAEFLNHHGEADGSSTSNRIANIITRGTHDKNLSESDKSAAFFYESLLRHGRPGFLWQKLREPRSYDYKKIESKGWDERLRMPKFPVNEQQIEAIATFVLGLVNDPPPPSYQYRPTGPARDIIEGEKLVDKYNCTGCHVLDMPSLTYKAPLAEIVGASREDLTKWFISNASKITSGDITQEMLAGRGNSEAIQPEEMRTPLATFITNAETLLVGQLDPSIDLKSGLATHLATLAGRSSGQPLKDWLKKHPETLVADAFQATDHADALRMLLKMKPAVNGLAAKAADDGRAVVTAHGLITTTPDPEEEDPDFRQYGLDLWQTLDVAGRIKLPSAKVTVKETDVVSQSGGRGGDLAHWLVPRLKEEMQDANKAWQASPPPLYKQGIKVQTPWMFRFLKNPEQLRYTTVLRMPRFNMSDEEAQTLANYFAAVDGVEYPYQSIPQQEANFVAAVENDYHASYPESTDSYDMHSWKLLNGPLCMKCHQLGGRPFVSTDPKTEVRGPNLDRVENRLQPDWVRVWIDKPVWFTSYTGMPQNFPADKEQFPELFGGHSESQILAAVFSLMNYGQMLERLGIVTYQPAAAPAAEADGATAAPPADASDESASDSAATEPKTDAAE